MPRILGCGLRGWTRPPSIPPAEGAALLLTCRGPSFPPVCPLGDPAQHRDSPWGAQSSRRGPLPNWTQGLGLGGAPASPALVSSSMSPSVFLGGLHIRLHVALCLPNPHHQTQQTHRKQAPRSPQMPPKRSSGFLEESPEPTASGVLGLGFTWGPHRGSCSSDTCQPPAPAFLARRMRGLVSILGVGRSEGSRENHLCTQLYPHFSVGSVLLPELSVQSRPPFRVSQQARGQQAGHHGATGSCFPGSRRCARGPGTGGRGSSRQPPPPTPEAVLHAPGWRCPDASTQCPCPGHNHVPTPWPALQCPLDLGPGGAQVRPRDSPPAVSAAGSAAAGLSSGSPGSILRETQERLVTGGDGRLGCSPHTKGEASKGSHAGPTSVVGKQGLGRPQLLPHGRSQL